MANPLLDKTGGRTRPLNELQEKERLNSDLARSQKALLRLAIAHYGENTELDQQLTLLSNTIRNPEKRNSLPRLIEDVVATIVSQDTQSRKSTDNPVAAAVCKIMQSLAERLQWEDHNDAPWGAIKHQLQGNPSANRLNAILEDCLRLICTRVEITSDGNDADEPVGQVRATIEKLLDCAKGALETCPDYEAIRARIAAAGSQVELLKLLDEAAVQLEQAVTRLAASPAAASSNASVLVARETLLSLLDKLSLPSKSEATVGEIRTLLAADAGRDQLTLAGTRLAELIRDILAQAREEVRELNNFLKQIMTGLQDVRQEMLTLSQTRSDSLQESETLQQSVNERMDVLHLSLDDATDLDALKASVAAHLEGFRTEVSTYIENERQRHRDAEAAVAKLSGQLQTLAGETLRLRDDIQQERRRALSDPLTGLANRLGMEERIAYEVTMWQRESYPLAVIIFDIDHFKNINDQFGHQAGDRVLKTIADQLRSQIRRTDFLARYGGEEFLMLLPRTKLADACQLADKLRHHIESCKFVYRDAQVPVTLSCGVAEFHQDDAADAVLDRADQALYIAKNEGRNRCFTEQDLSCPAPAASVEVCTALVAQ